VFFDEKEEYGYKLKISVEAEAEFFEAMIHEVISGGNFKF
jgi:hypothetical protein